MRRRAAGVAGKAVAGRQGNNISVDMACTIGVATGPVFQRRLPTVKQSGQLGCQSAWAVWHAVQRHWGSGSAVAA